MFVLKSFELGRAQDGGTLWDQDANEFVSRTLLEEAKVNLILRLIVEFKDWQYTAPEYQNIIQNRMALQDEYGRLTNYERWLSVILLRLIRHVEALQLTDLLKKK